MAEYIEREALINQFLTAGSLFTYGEKTIAAIISRINLQLAADVQEVRHARWDNDGHCTNCGFHAPYRCLTSEYFKSPFCHICGAKMDGKGDA